MEALKNPKLALLPSLQLARYLERTHPGLFPNVNAARCCIRRYRGAAGRENRAGRARVGGSKLFRPPEVPHNPWAGFPPSIKEFVWRVIPITSPLTAVISDLHFPYYDQEAFPACMADLAERQPDCILILGDLLDFYEISDFRKDPSVELLRQTLYMGYDFLKRLRREFPKARIIYRYGNHEVRWEHFFWRKAPEFCRQVPKLKELSWVLRRPSLFMLGPRDESDVLTPEKEAQEAAMEAAEDAAAVALRVEFVKDPVPFRIGKLALLHGDEILRKASTTVNAARTAFLKAQECVMIGHAHQRSEHSETTLEGRVVSTFSVPCLCNLHPRYSVHNSRWSHGHAFVRYEGGDNFHVTLRRIIKGKVY